MEPISRIARWTTRIVFSSCLCFGSSLSIAQAIYLNRDTLEFLKAQSALRAFETDRKEYARNRELERLKVPGYNVELSRTVAAFHSHIADMHHRHVDCTVCRGLVKQIRSFATRLDRAMK